MRSRSRANRANLDRRSLAQAAFALALPLTVGGIGGAATVAAIPGW